MNELYHYGVKGMRWGVRKDRRKSLGGKIEGVPKAKKNNNQNDGEDPSKKKLKAKKTIVNEAQNITKAISGARRKQPAREYSELKNMTDAQLRERVNRMNMEQQYTRLMDDKAARNAGESRVQHLMKIGGATLTVTSSALSIALAIKELKG